LDGGRPTSAITTINSLFDRVDELSEARDGLIGVAPSVPTMTHP
jgi:hypothetical protein